MISIAQFASALYGTWLLIRLDPRGLTYFEKTPGGFARSFLSGALLLPLQAAHLVLSYHNHRTKLAPVPYTVVESLAYVLSLVTFPFAMLYVTELLNRRERYLWYLVAYNWFQLAVGLVFLPLAILADLRLVTAKAAGFLSLFAIGVFFTYSSFIARNGLQIGLGTAVGVVLLDFVINQLIIQIVARI